MPAHAPKPTLPVFHPYLDSAIQIARVSWTFAPDGAVSENRMSSQIARRATDGPTSGAGRLFRNSYAPRSFGRAGLAEVVPSEAREGSSLIG